ncbi:MAG TPA: 6-pyruvoyl-tetrahydropterin synthase-related protein [Thermoflexales bacterium]|nr:6-pyruvoyl-tetrahydropterin synthase-related protein [Thermoflexales bacterium]
MPDAVPSDVAPPLSLARGLRAIAPWLGAGSIGLAAAQPLFAGLLPRGADILLHYYRIAALVEMLGQGFLYSRWFPFLAGGYGYPILLYYAPLAHYLGAGFHALGAGIGPATLLVFGLTLFLAATGTFAWARERLGDSGGLGAAAAYAFAPYVLLDVMARSALAEVLALAIVPWVFWALTRLQREGRPIHGLLAALSYAGLALSHNITALVFSPLLAVWALLLAVQAGRGRWLRDTSRAAAVLALGLGLSAFFWLPAFLERDLSQLDQALSAAYDFHTAFLPLAGLIALPVRFDFRLVNDTAPLGLSALSALLGALGWAGLVGRAARERGQRSSMLVWAGFLGAGTLVGALMTLDISTPLWEAIPLLRFVLYPSRFLGMTSLFLALLAGAGMSVLAGLGAGLLERLRGSPQVGEAVVTALLIGATMAYGFGWQYARRFPADPPAAIADIAAAERRLGIVGTTSIGEYLPRDAAVFPPVDSPSLALRAMAPISPALAASSRVEIASPLRYEAVLTTPAAMPIVFSQFYFPGWIAAIDGKAAPITPSKPEGLIQIVLPEGVHRLRVIFGSTPIRDLADGITLASLVIGGVIFVIVAIRRRDRRATAGPEWTGTWLLGGLVVVLSIGLSAYKSSALDTSTNALRGTRLAGPAVAGAQPVNANFNRALELIAADRPRVAPGREVVRVDLFWRALQPQPDRDYAVFTDLVDTNGMSIARLDTPHPDGVYPTSRWTPEEYTRDTRTFPLMPLTPPGDYVLRAGLYPKGVPQQRVPILDADGQSKGVSFEASLARVMTVTLGRPAASVAAADIRPGRRLTAALSAAVEIIGIDGELARAQPGQSLVVPLYWRANQTPGVDARVCFDLLGPPGRVDLGCQAPTPGFPLTQWQAGDVWRASASLRIPVAATGGTYVLRARLGEGVPQPLFDLILSARAHGLELPAGFAPITAPRVLGGFAEAAGLRLSEPIQAGKSITVSVLWRAASEAGRNFKAFVQLWDATGERRAGHDGDPCAGACPTEGWLPGEYLQDEHSVLLPDGLPPGEYRLIAGLYDPDTQRRLRAADGTDVVELGLIHISR